MGKTSVRMVNSNFDKETGVSTVTITSRYGRFTGQARIHPKDADHASIYAGCQYAETRAIIKYMKARKAEAWTQYKTMKNYYAMISSMKNFDSTTPEARRARRMIYTYEKEIQNWKDQIAATEENLYENMRQRDETVKNLRIMMKVRKNANPTADSEDMAKDR